MSDELISLADQLPTGPPVDDERDLQTSNIDPETGKRVYVTHRRKNINEAMIDFLIVNPGAKMSELGASFGYGASYVSRIVNSDIFQARLVERRAEVVNPGITANVQDRLTGLLALSADIVADELERFQNPKLAIQTLTVLAKANSFGARPQQINVANYVAVVPAKSADAEAWMASHRPVIEGEVG